MMDRGLPTVDGAPACPFVAFDDDREERATSPDSRHRCYAEVRPAPRALAHQDAYCLTNAFGVCPTFQDWARRESARIREDSTGPRAEDQRSQPAPPSSRATEAAASYPEEPARRNPQRGWSAPPPWTGSFEEDRFADPDPAAGGVPRRPPGQGFSGQEYGARRGDAGLAGSLAHRIAMDGQPPEGMSRQVPPTSRQGPPSTSRPAPPPPPWQVPPPASPVPPTRGQRELVDSGLASGGRGGLSPEWRSPSRSSEVDDEEPDWGEAAGEGYEHAQGEGDAASGARERLGTLGSSAGAALSRVGNLVPRGRPAAPGGARPAELSPASHVSQPRPRPTRRDPAAPPWERPVRYEAYPTLRTRIGMSGVPRVLLIFAALLLAAAGLFFLPTLLGVGGPKATPTPLPVPSRSPGPTFSFAPTPTPGPTFVTYVVQAGDTMSKIAAKFGVPLTTLIEANKDKYPNPDRITAGDTLIIPSALPSAFKDATPSRSPGKSP